MLGCESELVSPDARLRTSSVCDIVQTSAQIMLIFHRTVPNNEQRLENRSALCDGNIHNFLRDVADLFDIAAFRWLGYRPRFDKLSDSRRVTARRFEFVAKRCIAVAISAQTARHSGVETVNRQLHAVTVGVDVDAGPSAQSRVRLRADRHRSHVHDVFDFVRKLVRMAVDLKGRSADERVFRLVDVDVDVVALDGDGEVVRLVALTSENEFARRLHFRGHFVVVEGDDVMDVFAGAFEELTDGCRKRRIHIIN